MQFVPTAARSKTSATTAAHMAEVINPQVGAILDRSCQDCHSSRTNWPFEVVGWHSFRNTHATLLIEVGESIKTTQAILGHSDLNTTLTIYSHPIPESQRRAIDRVAEILDPNGLTSAESANTQRIN
jgi:site-specific recombinase XerC